MIQFPGIAAPTPGEAPGRLSRPRWATSVLGIVAFLLIWQLLGATVMAKSGSVPTPLEVARQMNRDGFSFYWRNASTTVSAAFKGWLWGNSLAIALALLVLVTPLIERPLLQLGITSYCLPIVAIGPVFAIVFTGETPKVILAAMSVFFTTLISSIMGLRSADPASLDLIHAYGGGTFKKLVKVRLRSALPNLFSALRIAAPAAILGAIIGEYLGAERGLGVAMINSQQGLEVSRTWALAIVATAVAGIAYAITAFIGRLVTPWAPKGNR
ncbi:MAG: binding-protein-dependent transport system inner rane component [Acidimicrobiia bacterium]|nr:binding-protein-dependent transport system inner rane component [Acidimicrobiia bacterium]